MSRRTFFPGGWGSSLVMAGFALAVGLLPVLAADEPIIGVTGLQQGSAYSGPQVPFIIAFRAAAPDHRVTRLEISIDGKLIDQKPHDPPAVEGAWKVVWDTTAWTEGKHTITIRAYDERGGSDVISLHVYVNNTGPDEAPPKIQVTQPAPGATISGRVPIRVKIEENVGIQWVLFYVDKDWKHMTNVPPYSWEWDTAKEENGLHEVWAQAIDASDLEGESEHIPVLVNNPGASGNLTRAPKGPVAAATLPLLPTAPWTGRSAFPPGPRSPLGRAATSWTPGILPAGETVPSFPRQPAAAPPVGGLSLSPNLIADFIPGPRSKVQPPLAGPASWPLVTALLPSPGPRVAGDRPTLIPQLRAVEGALVLSLPNLPSPSLSLPEGSRALISYSASPSLPVSPVAEGTRITPFSAGSRATVDRNGVRGGPPASPAPSPPPEGPKDYPARLSPTPVGPPSPTHEAESISPITTGATSVHLAAPPAQLQPEPSRINPTGPKSPSAPPLEEVTQTPLPPVQATAGPAPRLALTPRGAHVPRLSPQPPQAPAFSSVALAGPSRLSLPGQVPPRRVQPTALPVVPSQIVGQIHVVQAGESVYRIAQQYRTTVAQIARVNRLGRNYRIHPGQRLVLPRPALKSVFFDQQPVSVDVLPFQQRGISVTPFRHIFEHQGGKVDWKQDTKEVEARDEKRTIHLAIGSREAKVNQETLLMDVAAFIERGRTMVPLRFLGQALDVTIQVDPHSGNIYLTSNQ